MNDWEPSDSQWPPRREGRAWLVWSLLAVGLVGAGLVFWRNHQRPTDIVATPLATEASSSTVSAAHEEEVETEAASQSGVVEPDALLLRSAKREGFPRQVLGWFGHDGIVQRLAAAVHLLAQGYSPKPVLGFLSVEGRFAVHETLDAITIDEASYRRYDPLTDLVAGIDPGAAARVYRTMRPNLNRIYRQVNEDGKGFASALSDALEPLLAVQPLDGEIELAPKGGVFAFKNPELENLTAAQKHILRMGPKNHRKVQTFLRAFVDSAGLSVGDNFR
jgi:hypothetical protein